jgi:hypothetical protein
MNPFLAILASLAQAAPTGVSVAQQGGLIKPTSKVPTYIALGSILAAAIFAGIQASKAQSAAPALPAAGGPASA